MERFLRIAFSTKSTKYCLLVSLLALFILSAACEKAQFAKQNKKTSQNADNTLAPDDNKAEGDKKEDPSDKEVDLDLKVNFGQ